jgi:predicted lipid-binding transport protein (Tim44 family)
MLKKLMVVITTLTFAFTILGFGLADNASAKGYRSIKRSYSPPSHQIQTPKKSQSNSYNSTTKNPKSFFTNKSFSNKRGGGSFVKGMLLGGLGGYLMGHMFGSAFGGFGSIVAPFINIIFFIGILMIIWRVFRSIFRPRRY